MEQMLGWHEFYVAWAEMGEESQMCLWWVKIEQVGVSWPCHPVLMSDESQTWPYWYCKGRNGWQCPRFSFNFPPKMLTAIRRCSSTRLSTFVFQGVFRGFHAQPVAILDLRSSIFSAALVWRLLAVGPLHLALMYCSEARLITASRVTSWIARTALTAPPTHGVVHDAHLCRHSELISPSPQQSSARSIAPTVSIA